MSMWSSSFEDPLAHKDEIKEAKESGVYKRKSLVPVKAAPADANCSVFLEKETLKFLNTMQQDGKKVVGMKVLGQTFTLLKEIQLKKYYKASPEARENIIIDPQEILKKAVENARPLMSLQNVKKGSVYYQVPAPITDDRSYFEARRWIIKAARDRDTKNVRMPQALASILIETANDSGRVIAQRNEHHKLCEQNRAYAHYRITA